MYKIVRDKSAKIVEQKVSKLQDEGYVLIGPLLLDKVGKDTIYIQPVSTPMMMDMSPMPPQLDPNDQVE
jgi:hypothetical protein